MKFEEDFPNLKGKVMCFHSRVVEDGHGAEKGYVAEVKGKPVVNVDDRNWVYVKELKEHCLDKSLVLKAIENFKSNLKINTKPACEDGCCNEIEIQCILISLSELKEELGLDE